MSVTHKINCRRFELFDCSVSTDLRPTWTQFCVPQFPAATRLFLLPDWSLSECVCLHFESRRGVVVAKVCVPCQQTEQRPVRRWPFGT